jgi:hypothetical protein
MLRPKQLALCAFVGMAGSRLFAGDPGQSQQTSADGNNYHAPIPVNDPFPDAYYGADHGGSSLSLSYPYTSPFGFTDHSRGQFVFNVASFTPRSSEGVFGMDVWLEQQDGGGNWSPAAINGGLPDQYSPQYGGSGSPYWPVNTPNPGPSPTNRFTWTFNSSQLPPNTNFRVFVYVYIYNQGGGTQGDFPIYSATGAVNTGSANDAPRISWAGSFGSTNPTQVQAGQTYTISANGQDDNGNLVAVSINKNGVPYAYAGGGNGYSGNSQNPTSDPVGTVTYTAWAGDSYGAQSPTVTWTVSVIGKSNQAGVSSNNASIPFYAQNFTPAFNGGSGTGGWQFCISGYTNWDGGNSAYTGTNLGPSPGSSPSAVWVSSWSPPAPGSYQFYVARDGDSNFNASGVAGPYTLTVTPIAPLGSFDGVTPNPVLQNQVIGGSGWAADAQLGAPLSSVQILVDGGSHGSFFASLGGSRPDVQSANVNGGHWSPNNLTNSGWSFSFNVSGLSVGGHAFTAVAYDNSYGVSANIGSQNFTISAPANQIVAVSPTAATVYAGTAVNFSASGGANGYVWGGAASGSGGTNSVNFATSGSYTVTVYSPAGNGYAQSNTASASISVAARPNASLTATPANVNVGQSSALHAVYSTDATHGDALTNTVVNVVSPQGVETAFSANGANPINGNYSPPATGTYTFKAYATTSLSPGWTVYATATVSASLAPQFVAISPSGATISAGQQITFTASGGSNGYLWGGSASGSGSSQTVSFPSMGTFNVSVYSPAGGSYGQSNTAVATITVNPSAQTVSISPTGPSVQVGGSITFTVGGGQNGYVWGGMAAGSGTAKLVTFPNVGSFSVTVYSPAGGIFSQSNTAVAGITVTPASQTVTLTPTAPTVYAGQSVVFSASGGMNGYTWGGAATGSGPTQTVTFANQGSYLVSVFSPAGGNFSQSNTAAATATINPLASPASAQVTVTPQGGEVKVQNSHNPHNSQILIPGP